LISNDKSPPTHPTSFHLFNLRDEKKKVGRWLIIALPLDLSFLEICFLKTIKAFIEKEI
jgi:hypothetical protein